MRGDRGEDGDRDLRPPEWGPGREDPAPSAERGRRVSPAEAVSLDPTWLRAPLLLSRLPGMLLAVVLAATVLGVAAAVGPLYVASAGSGALRFELERASPWEAGLTVSAYGRFAGEVPGGGGTAEEVLAGRRRVLREATAGLRGLSGEVETVLGPEAVVAGTGHPAVVRFVARTGFLDHVQVVAEAGVAGIWVDERLAALLGVSPGDEVRVETASARARARVAGIVRELPSEVGWWAPVLERLEVTGGDREPPSLVLVPDGTMARLGGALGELGLFTWSYPLASPELSLPEGRSLAGAIHDVEARLATTTDPEVERLFQGATHGSRLPDLLARAEDAVDPLEGSVASLALAGVLVALALLGAVGVYAVRRRRAEVSALAAHGVGPAGLGGRAALAALLPVAAGTAAGWLLGRFLVGALGPGTVGDPSAVQASFRLALTGGVVAVVLSGAVSAAASRAEAREHVGGRAGEVLARAPWEAAVLLLAAVALYEILSREATAGSVDGLVLLFPLLFVSGLAGLAGRLLGRLLSRLRTAGAGRSSAAYLAARRLAATGRTSLVLVSAAATAVGVFAYAGILSASAGATARSTARVLTGAETRAVLPPNVRPPAELPFPATSVDRVRGTLLPEGRDVDLLVVEPGGFAEVAAWEPAFADRPLEGLLAGVSEPAAGGRLPLLAVGVGVPDGASLQLGLARLPASPGGRAEAFPGMPVDRPLVVTTRRAVEAAARAVGEDPDGIRGRAEVWARAGGDEVRAALLELGVAIERLEEVGDAARTLPFVALGWTLGLLQALGVLTGLIALAGLLLYVQSAQRAREASYALASRMGLGRRSHAGALLLEIGGLLGVAFVVGNALAALAARLVQDEIDLLPGLPPGPTLRFPLLQAALALGALLLAALAGAAQAQRSADRADPAEVLRGAG
ncbi:MAG: hypothetical protein HY658_12345 [Actinobacteria bacterium]|nr:hypothetical protein [Actinomycetota bacterium]